MTEPSPWSTYRLQLGPDLTFADVEKRLAYFERIGITHLYLSPIFEAAPGSTHGYDVVDPRAVSTVLGGEEALRSLGRSASGRGLGLLVDIVPNHLAAASQNPLWERLLAEGPGSEAAEFFDVDWDPPLEGVAGKVILPVLAEPYGEALAAGLLGVVEADGQLRLSYRDQSLPLSAPTREALTRGGAIEALHGEPGDLDSWSRLHGLLEHQHYRLVHWRAGEGLINYRRFFAIDELAGVRVERETVFSWTHERLLELVADGVIAALRVDHVDGLADPAGYLGRLRDETGPDVWITVEKILAVGERLPAWPVAGTTGYEFANEVLGLFIDPAAEESLDALAEEFDAVPLAWPELARACKREVLDGDLAADARRLAALLWHISQQDLSVRDVDDRACLEAINATIAWLGVYRTYVDPWTGNAEAEDQARIFQAAQAAATGGGAPDYLFAFLARALSGQAGDDAEHLELIRRFQQVSGAAMAKGVEDTALYRHRRLVALNEVGGEPGRFGVSATEFHVANAERSERHALGMITTATHDAKRGEDVRLRIAALSEIAGAWGEAARRWRDLNRPSVRQTPDGPAPDPSTEYLLYQTAVGAWPPDPPDALPDAAFRERIVDYMIKACREAGERTSWIEPDEAFEGGVAAFAEAALDPERSPEFVEDLRRIARRAGEIAVMTGLSQVLLRCLSPGVPDLYQGLELWGDYLVDPDNRRPVDWALRERLLAEIDGPDIDPSELFAARRDGRIKLWVLSRSLRARREFPECFAPAARYVPLEASGRFADRLVASARVAPDGRAVVAVASRLPALVMGSALDPPVGERWEDSAVLLPPELANRSWRDLLGGQSFHAGGEILAASAMSALPVSLSVAG
ncbi:MAG TPA: malto-oligosyltrehalose synthase [Egibacteraceae bacterium]|nr:malto-oligosyltrehalose synthase [Egibacteraceae bacterium]